MLVEARLHGILERECLDDADALQGFLQRLHDACGAGELVQRNGLDAVDELAQDEHRRRHDDDAEQRHDRVLNGHDRGKPDQREEVAADRGNEQIEHLCGSGGASVQPRDEFRAVPVGKEADIMLQQACEQSALIFGNDAIADPRHCERLPIGGEPLDHENTGGHERKDNDAGQVLVHVGLVDDVADEIGAKRGRRGSDHHHGERKGVAAPLSRGLLEQKAADEGGPAVGIRKQFLEI